MNVERELATVRENNRRRSDQLFGALFRRLENDRRAERGLPPIGDPGPPAPFQPATQAQAYGYAIETLRMGLEQFGRDLAAGMAAARGRR